MVNVPKSYLPEESFFTPNYSVKWISPVPWLQSFGRRDIFLKTNTESSRLECGRCSSMLSLDIGNFFSLAGGPVRLLRQGHRVGREVHEGLCSCGAAGVSEDDGLLSNSQQQPDCGKLGVSLMVNGCTVNRQIGGLWDFNWQHIFHDYGWFCGANGF